MAERRGRFRYVTTVTPLRLSFAGGGTDFPEFYLQHGGAVVSTSLDKYIYVTAKQHSSLFNEKYRLSYSKTEHADSIDDIENAIARECLRLVPVEPPLFINTVADLPASTGLGSSSSFAVGLLYALHTLLGNDVSSGQLAEEACQVELGALRRPIGKQDQYAAAIGGLNHICFDQSGRVILDPLSLPGDELKRLFSYSMMFWTGLTRNADEVLSVQRAAINDRIEELCAMRDMADKARDILLNGFDAKLFGSVLHENWENKRRLAPSISNSVIDEYYEKALRAGAYGGKIAGAGAGGFLYLVVPPERQPAIRAALAMMEEIEINHEPRGSRVLFTTP